MKKILFLLFIILSVVACKEEAPKDYVTLNGKISNNSNEILTIMGKNFKKDIKVNQDGTFSDTLKVTDGFHGFIDGKMRSFIYLKNGFDIELSFDENDFPNSISFNGNGSGPNNYFLEKTDLIKNEKMNDIKSLFKLDKQGFDSKMENFTNKVNTLIENAEGLDTELIKKEKESIKKAIDFYNSNYAKEHANMALFKKGAPSPKFNYPDTNGKMVSLDDLKGKYVYIDVWATWCGPCKKEIPFLKKLNDEYKNKEIAIVSLSIDKQEHKDKWLKMVKEENLQGIQIMADNDWNSGFVKAYNIQGIPRFILVDKEGNIVDADAPRPSNPNLKELFNSLGI